MSYCAEGSERDDRGDLRGGPRRGLDRDPVGRRLRVGGEHRDESAEPGEAGVVVRLAEVDRPADRRVHGGAAELLGGDVLADRRLHQRRPGEIEPRPFGHQHGVAEHRQVRPARDAVAHDRRDLRDAARREDRVVAEDAAEVVLVGEDLVLHRQEDARRSRRGRSSGSRFSPAIAWARSTFLIVIGKKAPAFTVASLAMIMTRRPATRPIPVTTPAAGAPPHSSYIS